MRERHEILSRTIGYLDEEQEAMDRGNLLLILSTTIMIVASLLQIIFFYLYNGPFHPFANILADDSKGNDSLTLQGVPFSIYLFQMTLPLQPLILQPML